MNSARLASAYAIISALFFAAANSLIENRLKGFSSYSLVFFRGAFGVLFLLPWALRDFPTLLRRPLGPILFRSLAGALAIGCLFLTLKGTSATHASFLASLAPFFLALFSGRLALSRMKTTETFGVALVLIGTLAVAGNPAEPAPFWVWVFGILGASLSAVAMLSLKKAGEIYSSSLIVFCLSLALMLLGYPLSRASGMPLVMRDWNWIVGMVAFSISGQLLMTSAYRSLHPQVANALGRSLILWAALIDYFVTGRVPGFLEATGYLLATLGVVILQVLPSIPLSKRVFKKAPSVPPNALVEHSLGFVMSCSLVKTNTNIESDRKTIEK